MALVRLGRNQTYRPVYAFNDADLEMLRICLTDSSMLITCGCAFCSSNLAYGIGTSVPVTRITGASRQSNAGPTTGISLFYPKYGRHLIILPDPKHASHHATKHRAGVIAFTHTCIILYTTVSNTTSGVSNQSFSCDGLARTVSDVSLLVLDSECMLLCVLL